MRKYITKASERIGVESTSRDGKRAQVVSYDIVNIGLHFSLKYVRPYAAPCSEALYCCRLTIGGSPPLAEQILRLFQ